MFQNVLIGVDGRQGGRDAIALARQLAGAGAELTLAHIDSAPVGAVSGLDRDRSRRLLEDTRESLHIPAQTALTFSLSVGRGLHELAEGIGADLLVVGSSHRALLGRVMLGDSSVGSLDGTPCAIAVATRGYAEPVHSWRRVGVGYDGSAESERALDVAREVAERYGAQLEAFHVVTFGEVDEFEPLPADWPRAIEELIDIRTAQLDRREGVHAASSYGGSGEELVEFSGGVDLIVVGSRGYGPLGRLFHGSVSHYLVQHAKCPVLVLPRQALEHPVVTSAREMPAEARTSA